MSIAMFEPIQEPNSCIQALYVLSGTMYRRIIGSSIMQPNLVTCNRLLLPQMLLAIDASSKLHEH